MHLKFSINYLKLGVQFVQNSTRSEYLCINSYHFLVMTVY